MKKSYVIWYNDHKDEGISDDNYWDVSMLKQYFNNSIWDPVGSYQIGHKNNLGNIIVITGRHHQKDIKKINRAIAKRDWVIIFVVGDEENDFPVEELVHPRMSVWVMSPNPDRHRGFHTMGSGWPHQIKETKRPYPEARENEWFFSGQISHSQRELMVKILRDLPRGELNETEGFTQGYDHQTYYQKMLQAKAIPCPAGPFTPDSFRLFEALELGCVPIAGAVPSVPYPDNYWKNLFGTVPFPVISDWNGLPHLITTVREQWPELSNKVYGWWQDYKREQAYEIHDEIYRYVCERPKMTLKDQITVLIPTSPISSHPSLEIIEKTIESVRSRLPECEILIMCDGIREEQTHYTSTYNQYLSKLLWKCNWEWKNVLPIIFPEYAHQAAMTRYTLDKVRTPAILFVEHDCPLEGEIPFEALVQPIMFRKLDVIRLHHETKIGDYHQHLMLDQTPIDIMGAPYVRTVQWSQRPHLANTDYYRKIMSEHFSEHSRTMIEDLMHSVAQTHPWDEHRIAIYHNEGNIQHSVTTDGRGDDPKFDSVF